MASHARNLDLARMLTARGWWQRAGNAHTIAEHLGDARVRLTYSDSRVSDTGLNWCSTCLRPGHGLAQPWRVALARPRTAPRRQRVPAA